MRFGFVTCVELGLSCMQTIYDGGGRLDLAITLEDDMAQTKSGRVYLDGFCVERSIPLHKVRQLNSDRAVAVLRDARLDWLFVIGWSQIAHADVLAAPARGVLGIHPTLLPEGRGRAAIPWAILKRLDRTGVTLFKLDEGVDTGEIAAQLEIPMQQDENATDLYRRVNAAHVQLVRQAYPLLERDALVLDAQDHSQATVWPARRPENGEIDLSGTLADAEVLIRAVTRPYPGAFVRNGAEILRIWSARTQVGTTDNSSAPVLRFADGALIATDWEVEASSLDIAKLKG